MEVALEDFVEPKQVLASQEICQAGEKSKQWLIKWKGKTMHATAQEDDYVIRSQFPHFCLEDKAVFPADDNDGTKRCGRGPKP